MVALKVSKLGNSLGVTLPKEAAASLHVTAGDTLFLTEAPGGGYRVTPYDPDFERHMDVARGVMNRRRNALRELAKA
jgi:putative addiction module antidote